MRARPPLSPLTPAAAEPTSGLDSAIALTVVEDLWDVSRTGKPVLLSIHQPSSQIWKLLDSVCFLSAFGHLLYTGPRDKAVDFFVECGYSAPDEGVNPADHLMALTSAQSVEQAEKMADAFAEKQRITLAASSNLADHVVDDVFASSPAVEPETEELQKERVRRYHRSTADWWTQFTELSMRTAMNSVRNPMLLYLNYGAVLVAGLVAGVVYQGLELDFYGLQDRLGFFLFSFLLFSVTSLSSIGVWREERLLFLRERASNTYRYVTASRHTLRLLVLTPTTGTAQHWAVLLGEGAVGSRAVAHRPPVHLQLYCVLFHRVEAGGDSFVYFHCRHCHGERHQFGTVHGSRRRSSVDIFGQPDRLVCAAVHHTTVRADESQPKRRGHHAVCPPATILHELRLRDARQQRNRGQNLQSRAEASRRGGAPDLPRYRRNRPPDVRDGGGQHRGRRDCPLSNACSVPQPRLLYLVELCEGAPLDAMKHGLSCKTMNLNHRITCEFITQLRAPAALAAATRKLPPDTGKVPAAEELLQRMHLVCAGENEHADLEDTPPLNPGVGGLAGVAELDLTVALVLLLALDVTHLIVKLANLQLERGQVLLARNLVVVDCHLTYVEAKVNAL